MMLDVVDQNIEHLHNLLSDEKMEKLNFLIKKGEIKKDCDVFELKTKLDFLPNENHALKKVLDEIDDITIIPVLIDYKNQIRNLKKELDGKTTLVWTSPIIDLNADLTYNTMIQMIRSAHKKITIVGYALYKESKNDKLKMSDIFKELYKKVEQKVLVELFFDGDETEVMNTIKKMWKKEIKLPDVWFYKKLSKRDGSLHAKVLLVDDTQILITSANMTGKAINRNLEIGIKTSGNVGKEARKLLFSLIDAKLFEKQGWF